MFIDGRKIDTLALNSVSFWDMLADRYWKKRNVTRPDSTRPSTGSESSAP